MKLAFLLLFVCCTSLNAFPQMVLMDPVTNRTFNTEKYSAVRGTPFLFENWKKGTATSQRGIYKNLELKLDAYENILYFNKEDKPYEFQDQIQSFTLVSSGDTLYYKKGVTAGNIKPEQYVQVLAEGKVSFYKSDIKSISEMSEVNAGMVKTFITSTRYYIVKDGKSELVKLNKDIVDFMEDKKDQVKQYMDTNNLSPKKESDVAKLIRYYNTL